MNSIEIARFKASLPRVSDRTVRELGEKLATDYECLAEKQVQDTQRMTATAKRLLTYKTKDAEKALDELVKALDYYAGRV